MPRQAARVLWDEDEVDIGPPRPQLTMLVTRTDEPRPEREERRPEPPRRRQRTAPRAGARPDRVAMWAVVLGMFLVLVATATADAAPL